MSHSKTTMLPRSGEIWRNENGAVRHVRHVDDDGYSITYSRPAPAHPDWRTVLMHDWLTWVEVTKAVKKRKRGTVEDKDWGYATYG